MAVANPSVSARRPNNWCYSGGLDVSYELDLFGRVRRDIEATRDDKGAKRGVAVVDHPDLEPGFSFELRIRLCNSLQRCRDPALPHTVQMIRPRLEHHAPFLLVGVPVVSRTHGVGRYMC